MATFTNASENNHDIKISTAIESMYKGQDYICQGEGTDSETGEPFQWIMLNDGHGTNSCINCIKSIPIDKKSELIGKPNPIAALAEYIDESKRIFKREPSGATAVILKCYANRGEVITCGDSQAVIFKDGAIVHITEEHNCSNPNERIRLIERGVTFFESKNIKVVSPNEMIHIPTEYAVFDINHQIACTQALGHNSITGYSPDKYVIYFDECSTYKIILGSDGIFDMIMMDDKNDLAVLCEKDGIEIKDWVLARWLQQWETEFPGFGKQYFTYEKKDCDDISVATIIVCPKI
jgi:hypothetical protein